MAVATGDTFTVERTFSKEDLTQFVGVSRDENDSHVVEDEQGRITLHGLLTATLPTLISGRLKLVTRTMDLDFVAPVYTGDRIECAVTVASAEERDYGTKVHVEATARNQDGDDVLNCRMFGIIRKPN